MSRLLGCEVAPRATARTITLALAGFVDAALRARATGKTTTCGRVAATPVRLGRQREAAALRSDPAAVLRGQPKPILIDEWQLAPRCCRSSRNKLTLMHRQGSSWLPGLCEATSTLPMWPGTGRLVRLAMYGLTERELAGRTDAATWVSNVVEHGATEVTSALDLRSYVELALRSGFPEPALRLNEASRQRWLTSYIDQIITRDAVELSSGAIRLAFDGTSKQSR